MNDKILVSCIVPVYNREKFILRTLNSLHKQEHRPLEIIIVNDGSTDCSEKKILEWKSIYEEKEFNIKYFRQINMGACHARNLGMEKSSGEFIQFLDSDDTIEYNKISKQILLMKQNKADVAYCDFIMKNHKNEIIKKENCGNILLRLALGWSVSIFTPLIRRESIINKVKWNTHLTQKQDKEFMFKVFIQCKNIIYTPGYMCIYYLHDDIRISDRYYTSFPDFFLFFKSYLIYFIKYFSEIPQNNHIYILLRLMFIPINAMKFCLNRLIKLI
jgi:glycosyltransferase involved in cell wall biosynthesis